MAMRFCAVLCLLILPGLSVVLGSESEDSSEEALRPLLLSLLQKASSPPVRTQVVSLNVPVPPGNAPVRPVNAPVRPVNAPVLTVNLPVLPGNAPVPPVNNPVLPGNARLLPVNAPVLPGNGPLLPVNVQMLPGNAPLFPVNAPVLPVNTPVLPANAPLLPVNAQLLPANSPLFPANGPVVSLNSPNAQQPSNPPNVVYMVPCDTPLHPAAVQNPLGLPPVPFPPQTSPYLPPLDPWVPYPNVGAGGLGNGLFGAMPYPPPFPTSPFLQQSPPFIDHLTNPLPPTSQHGVQIPGSQPTRGKAIEVQPQEVPGQPGVLFVPPILAPMIPRAPYLPSMQFDSPVAEGAPSEQTDPQRLATPHTDAMQKEIPEEAEVTDHDPTLDGSAVTKDLQ